MPLSKTLFFFLAAALMALRLAHMGAEIDLPHDWRQCDTAHYIDDFYQHGVDLFHPSVCWMGPKGTVIFEFPLPEALVAWAMKVMGYSVWGMRLVFLVFFGLAAGYFFASVRLVFGEELARISTLVYLALPLSLFYSRAIHIDFFVLACTHAMLFYFLKGIELCELKFLIISSLVAVPAFLVKAPYVFFLALPMAVFTWKSDALRWLLPRAVCFLVPVIAFWVWQRHANAVNGQAPDWGFIFTYRKFDNNTHWYFGNWSQRLMPYNWKVLLQRMVLEVAGPGGILFVVWGVWNSSRLKMSAFIWAWVAGLLVLLGVFFNLQVIHNYYQLPFLAVAALFAGHGLLRIKAQFPRWFYPAMAVLVAGNVAYAEMSYYQVPHELVEIGGHIGANTPPDALVIVTYQNFDCRNPRILYRARRLGWSIEHAALNTETLEKLRAEGATHWVFAGPGLPEMPLPSGLNARKVIPLSANSDSLFIFSWQKP